MAESGCRLAHLLGSSRPSPPMRRQAAAPALQPPHVEDPAYAAIMHRGVPAPAAGVWVPALSASDLRGAAPGFSPLVARLPLRVRAGEAGDRRHQRRRSAKSRWVDDPAATPAWIRHATFLPAPTMRFLPGVQLRARRRRFIESPCRSQQHEQFPRHTGALDTPLADDGRWRSGRGLGEFFTSDYRAPGNSSGRIHMEPPELQRLGAGVASPPPSDHAPQRRGSVRCR